MLVSLSLFVITLSENFDHVLLQNSLLPEIEGVNDSLGKKPRNRAAQWLLRSKISHLDVRGLACGSNQLESVLAFDMRKEANVFAEVQHHGK